VRQRRKRKRGRGNPPFFILKKKKGKKTNDDAGMLRTPVVAEPDAQKRQEGSERKRSRLRVSGSYCEEKKKKRRQLLYFRRERKGNSDIPRHAPEKDEPAWPYQKEGKGDVPFVP